MPSPTPDESVDDAVVAEETAAGETAAGETAADEDVVAAESVEQAPAEADAESDAVAESTADAVGDTDDEVADAVAEDEVAEEEPSAEEPESEEEPSDATAEEASAEAEESEEPTSAADESPAESAGESDGEPSEDLVAEADHEPDEEPDVELDEEADVEPDEDADVVSEGIEPEASDEEPEKSEEPADEPEAVVEDAEPETAEHETADEPDEVTDTDVDTSAETAGEVSDEVSDKVSDEEAVEPEVEEPDTEPEAELVEEPDDNVGADEEPVEEPVDEPVEEPVTILKSVPDTEALGTTEPADADAVPADAVLATSAELAPGDRLFGALRHPSRAQIVVGLLLAVLGFAAVTQVRSNENDDTYAGRREQDLIDLLNGLNGASERSQDEINRLEIAKADLQSDTLKHEAALEQAQKQADTLNILAGLVPVSGPGLRITIDDPEGNVDIDLLLDAIQELRTAGAEAMAFNDQVRVVAQTAFEDGVGGVIVDGQLLSPPYVIDVIGEPHELEGAMTFPQGPIDDVEDDGGTVEMKTFDNLDINVVRQLNRADYAQPNN
ncbi:MAG TPA: DUF881 domain-containing protein [Nocardioides sp.]